MPSKGKKYLSWKAKRRAAGKKASYSDWRKKKSLGRASQLTYYGSFPMPDMYKCKMKFSQDSYLATTAGIRATKVFRMNGLYDPDYSGIGFQPYLFDQLCGASNTATAIYQRYRVYATKVNLKVISHPNNLIPTQVYLYPVNSEDDSVPASPPDLDELKYIKRVDCGLLVAGDAQKEINHYMSIPKIQGITKVQFEGDHEYAAHGANNPNKVPKWCLVVQPIIPTATDDLTIYYNITFTYYVQFYDISSNISGS